MSIMKFATLKRHCSSAYRLKLLRFFFYITGGIYKATEVPKTVKILWICCCFVTLTLIIIVGALGYLVTAEKIDILAIYALLWSVDCAINIIIIVPAITYRYHRKFEKLINFIEKCSTSYPSSSILFDDSSTMNNYIYLEKCNTLSEALFWLTTELSAALVFSMIGFIDMMYMCSNENSFRDIHHHLIGYPYMHRVSSMRTALLIYTVEFVMWMSGISVAVCHINLLMIIANELNNITVEYCQRIQNLIVFINELTQPSLFQQKLINLIKQHQYLVKIVETIRPYMEIFSTLTQITNVAGLLCVIYVILLTDFEVVLRLKQMILAVAFCIYFYPQCEFGNKINTMNEAIHKQVYNLPWYNLPPKQRTLVFIFLSQVQRPIEFKAFIVYPVNRETFPSVLRKTYSLLNVLRYTNRFENS